jgi:pyruvate, orthophosphate dikinase
MQQNHVPPHFFFFIIDLVSNLDCESSVECLFCARGGEGQVGAMRKWVYTFGNGQSEGSAGDHEILGSKGANLAEMSSLGLPVPAGMTIISGACTWYCDHQRHFPESLEKQVLQAISVVEGATSRRFGKTAKPLLLAIRPGSRVPVPGMMEAILNLGLNDETVEALADETGDRRFAYDCYRRFISSYADAVMGLDRGFFEDVADAEKERRGIALDTDLDAEALAAICKASKAMIREELGEAFPDEPLAQVWGALEAAYTAWMAPRAVAYRTLHAIPAEWGTAINIQAMVFGNRNAGSASGVAFTRNPETGESGLWGEFLPLAQGSELALGIRTPHPVSKKAIRRENGDRQPLETLMPKAYEAFASAAAKLEQHYRDMQDIEFAIEDGRFYLLQARPAKRGIKAALRVAVEMASEKLITREEAVARIDPLSLEQLLHPAIDPAADRDVIGTGLPASPGAASGEIVFTSEDAIAAYREGRKVILVRSETSPEDIHGMHVAEGVLTSRGGLTSHAAVVARGMGIPCVAGASGIRIDMVAGTMTSFGVTLSKGDFVTIDGSLGQIIKGQVAMIQPELSGDFAKVMEWSDSIRRLGVRTNADTPADARVARSFGAEGIGLCRTEHMFFEEGRINVMREMILADSEDGRRQALGRLLPMQRSDFIELFEIMHGQPVTIRLLDPPLHEFLPKAQDDIAETAAVMGMDEAHLRQRIEDMHEFNPMLGHRGCRLAISYPEVAEMQARAIFEAAVKAAQSTGSPVVPEIMVPLVSLRTELDYVKARIDEVAKRVAEETGVYIEYLVGTMIELPRAALRGQEIAESAEFFSFGTNDLTQTTFGISRDDAGAFLTTYRQKGIIDQDPFASLDFEGVGELIRIGCERGRKARNDLKLGICGEHAGDPASIRFCEVTGLDYISCSPFRVPIARLAAAQAVVGASVR